MTQQKKPSLIVAVVAVATCITIGANQATAAPPSVRQAGLDYEASGYVTPAGLVHPSLYQGGVVPVGYMSAGCDSCDAGGYDSCDACACGAGSCCSNGLLGQLVQGCGCGSTGGLSPMRFLCIFCQGNGCSACQMLSNGGICGALNGCKPFGDAGLCAQRWYDLSAEATFLTHSDGDLRGDVTSLGVSPPGAIVLRAQDTEAGDDFEAGMRLSAAFIFGVGGNLEATYMGNNDWRSSASAIDFPGGQLFSFVSFFGTDPAGGPGGPGFDDTDRSLIQTVASESVFHSGEINYRRRTMGPYCRFQGSWLVGLRYLRFDNAFVYSTDGLNGFFTSNDRIKNNLFGAQSGFDLWWNMTPGVNLGIGMKGAWVQNDLKRGTRLSGNSFATVAVTDTDQDTTIMGEFEGKLVYRLNHSWTIRSAYYLIAIEDIGFALADRDTIRSVNVFPPGPVQEPADYFHSLVIQGFSVGAEFMW